jgi:hypothetical protein
MISTLDTELHLSFRTPKGLRTAVSTLLVPLSLLIYYAVCAKSYTRSLVDWQIARPTRAKSAFRFGPAASSWLMIISSAQTSWQFLYCAVDRYPKGAVKGRRLLKAVLRAMMNLPVVCARHDLHSSSLTGDESYVVGQVRKLYANGDALGQPNPSEDRVHIG